MNMLERFLGHDQAMTAELLARCATLTDAELDGEVYAGWGSVRHTFEHMLGNIEVWTDLMAARPVRTGPRGLSIAALTAQYEQSYGEFATLARRLEAEGRLDELWTDVLDEPPQQKSYGGAIGHVITHNMHHRSELLHMMTRLGMTDLPEGDLMGWDQRTRLAG